jgi:hypothetical protein
MTIKQTIAVSAIALGLCLTAPAYAQQASNSQAGAIGAVATATNTSTDLNMQDSNNDNSVTDANKLAFALASYNTDNTNNSVNGSNNGNDNSSIVADQDLRATSNGAPVLFLSLASDNSSGDNSVSGSAFAAYAGILNTAWNTGINSNAQAATNVAARGTVTFGN